MIITINWKKRFNNMGQNGTKRYVSVSVFMFTVLKFSV